MVALELFHGLLIKLSWDHREHWNCILSPVHPFYAKAAHQQRLSQLAASAMVSATAQTR